MNIKNQDSAPPLLSKAMSRIDTSAIRRMFDLASSLKDPINLSIGQPHFPTPDPIREALAKAVRDGKTAYSQTKGILELRERLSQKYSQVNGIRDAHPDNILVSSGVASLLQLVFLTTLNINGKSGLKAGDQILLTDPSFLIYKSMAEFFGVHIQYIPETFNQDDIVSFYSNNKRKNLKLIIISHPSNPSGHIYSKDQLELLANLAERSGALLVCDEIYELYDYDQRFCSPGSFYPQTLTLSGFSKSYSMTGLRLSCAHGPKEIIQAMTTLQQYTVVCAPTPVQYAGTTALDTDMSSYILDYKNKRNYCQKALGEILEYTYPAGAFYIFAKLPKFSKNKSKSTHIKDQDFIEYAIKEKQLLLVPGHIFSNSKHHIRISYATDQETLERGINALKDLVTAYF